jgi:hypothetical protein
LTTLGWSQAVRDSAQRWSPDMIHDSVAAIARQPAYSASFRQSLLGRFLRFLLDRLRDLQAALGHSPGAKLTVIVGVALIVFVIVARIVMARRIEDDRAGRRGRGAGGKARTDYWTRAQDLARGGDHDAACHALYAAVLDELVRRGAIRFHPSKTIGDYARELARRGAPAAPAFLAFARQFERIVYGPGVIAAEDFERLERAAALAVPAPAAA